MAEYARPQSGTRSWSAQLHSLGQSRPTLILHNILLFCLQAVLEATSVGVGETHMNSLTYLSRQFDVLASPRTPPSTPLSESLPSLPERHRDVTLKRIRTWSNKSFQILQPESPPSGGWTLKRSFSSPAEVSPPVEPTPRPPLRPPRPSSRRPSVSPAEKAIRPKPASEASETILTHLLFVRIILLLWNALVAAWRSVARQGVARMADEVAVEDGSDEDEKDTEDESKDEKPVLLDLQQPPFQPAIPSPLSPSPPPYPPSPPESITLIPIPATISPELPAVLDTPPVPTPEALTQTTVAPATHAGGTSRSSTPTLATHKTPFHLPKTLVLDLDETLIHSTSRPMSSMTSGGSGLLGFGRRNKGAGHMVEVVLGGRSTLYHVYKRPFVDYFLRKVSGWYTLVIFTASMQEYADPVIDWLDAGRGILGRRLFREACTQLPNGSYTKDLSIVEQDLSRVCLIDNSPICYSVNEANGIPIEGWTHDPHDEALLDLLPVLDSLRFTSDVRRVLGIRGFS